MSLSYHDMVRGLSGLFVPHASGPTQDNRPPAPQGQPTSFEWATVTGIGPVTVQLDGDTSAMTYLPDSLIDTSVLAVNDRVWCQNYGTYVVILGRSGGIDMFQPTCVVYPTAATGLTGAFTPIVFGQASINTGATPMWNSGNPSVVTIQEAGIYIASGKVDFNTAAWTAGKAAEAAIEKNGSVLEFGYTVYSGSVSVSTAVAVNAHIFQAAVGDQITLNALQTNGGTINCATGETYTSLSVRRLGP